MKIRFLILCFIFLIPVSSFASSAKFTSARTNIVTLDENHSAAGLIGQTIYDSRHNPLSKIDDVLIDRKGRAMQLVMPDDGSFGHAGRQVTIGYDMLILKDADGDAVMTAPAELGDKVGTYRTIPPGRISIASLLRAGLVNPGGEKMVNVANLTIADGYVQYIVISFNDLTRNGADQAVIPFDELRLRQNDDGSVDFLLTANQTKILENFRARAVNTHS